MKYLAVAALALFLVLPGAMAVFVPSKLIEFSKRFLTANGKLVAAAIRVLAGVILWFAAGLSRDPDLIQFFAVLFVAGGLITLFIKLEVFEKMLGWFFSWPSLGIRVWGVAAIALGVWLIGAF